MASTVKLAVAAAYLSQVDAGRRSLFDMIGGRTAAAQIELMMVRSDNAATDRLIRNLGGTHVVQQWLDFHGFSGLRIDRTIAQLLSAKRDLRDYSRFDLGRTRWSASFGRSTAGRCSGRPAAPIC